MKLTYAVAVLAVALLAGCSSKSAGTPDDAVSPPAAGCSNPALSQAQWIDHCASTSAKPRAVDHEGSVTTKDGSFVRYPDGLTVRLTRVTTSTDVSSFDDAKPGQTVAVTVTERLANNGPAPIKLTTDLYFEAELLYGQNRYTAEAWADIEGTHTVDDLPQRLMPGTSAIATNLFTMPKTGLSDLAFTVSPNSSHYTEYTFTDVQTLIH